MASFPVIQIRPIGNLKAEYANDESEEDDRSGFVNLGSDDRFFFPPAART